MSPDPLTRTTDFETTASVMARVKGLLRYSRTPIAPSHCGLEDMQDHYRQDARAAARLLLARYKLMRRAERAGGTTALAAPNNPADVTVTLAISGNALVRILNAAGARASHHDDIELQALVDLARDELARQSQAANRGNER